MRKFIFVVLCLALFIPSSTTAQEDAIECEPDIAAVQTVLDEAQQEFEEGNTEAALSLMDDAQNQLALAEAQCLGLVFSDNSAAVFGPVFMGEGIYRARVVTEGFFILQAVPLEGDCGQGSGSFLSPYVFNVSRGEATEGAESIFTVNTDGCEVLLETSNIQSKYTLTFEKVR